MKKSVAGVALCAATVFGLGGTTFAGEWGPGNGLTPINPEGPNGGSRANSECAFSGRDEPDDTETHTDPPSDDFLWRELAPAGKNSSRADHGVQSPGQMVAIGFIDPHVTGQACRGGGSG